MSNKKQTPYGSWESIITPDKIIEGGLKFNEVRIDNKAIHVNEAKLIQAEGTWTYIILTLSPCK